MAPTKKAAKKATKKAASKKAVKKTAASNKTTKKTTASKKATPKKVDKPKVTTTTSSDKWKTLSIISGVIVLVLILILGGILFMDKGTSEQLDNQSTSPTITLTIIEDPTCASCQVDVFAQEVKDNLIPELEVEKIDASSQEGQAILAELNLIQVPAYIFSKNIDERSDWATQLASAFIAISIDGENQYLLNPSYVPTKVLVSEPVVLEGSVVVGDPNAPVTIIEFSDYECPYCAIAEGNPELVAQFAAQSPGYVPPMPSVYEEYVETGKVKVVFNNMPLESLHPEVMPVHLAAMCANEQGEWKAFHDKVFTDRSDWTASSDYSVKMKEYAVELGLDSTQFNECLDSEKYLSQIQQELALGQQYGVSGTPAFFVGKTFLSGAQDYSTFKAAIEAELALVE